MAVSNCADRRNGDGFDERIDEQLACERRRLGIVELAFEQEPARGGRNQIAAPFAVG